MKKPNVVFVITDDQGYGDLGCTGNPHIQTPHIDGFYSDAVRFTDYHVAPLCAPTRGALMTGHRPMRNGVWATCWGRSILKKEETTLAEVFRDQGYQTGMFGKWHLGDNYPYRPQDRGFTHVVAHKGGGVGQTPDFWGNNYFDDTYFHNGEPVAHEGYCTDVWFHEALKFIEANKEQPFFAYIATNAPHEPYLVADRYAQRYRGNPDIPYPEFFGMITNIDENFGLLRKRLAELGLADNTILVFMTDNGSSGCGNFDRSEFLVNGYNAGMRGKKGSYYEGGHRVPFFIRYPGGGIGGGKDIPDLALHVDFFPTMADLCGLSCENLDFDGISLKPLLLGQGGVPDDRLDFVQYRQDTNPPDLWDSAVIQGKWRLVRGKELYDIRSDPGQETDVADRHPDLVQRLRSEHEAWWKTIEPDLYRYSPIYLGSEAENPTRLDAMDVMGDVAWSQAMVAMARRSAGRWSVKVTRPGTYRFSLRRWPLECGLGLGDTLGMEDALRLAPYQQVKSVGRLDPASARVVIFGRQHTVDGLSGNDQDAVFEIPLAETGDTILEAHFLDVGGEATGAYYVYVERLGDND